MALETEQKAIGVFKKRSDVEVALSELKAANYPMDKVSVVARNAEQEEDIVGVKVKEHSGNKADEGASVGATTGGAVGSLTGLLVGLGLVAIPAVGPIMLAGAGATALATALAGGLIGAAAGSLAGALVGLGIPEDEAKIYSDLVEQGNYLVIVDCNEQEIILAERILRHRGITDWRVYQSSTPIKGRYKKAAGLFFKLQYLQKALSQLQDAGFLMNQVYIVSSGLVLDERFAKVNILSKDDWSGLGIPKDIAENYQHRLKIGDYLIAISAPDLEMAAAKNILEANHIEDFHLYNPLIYQTVSNNF
jgi:uncharacterized membrane protein